VYSINKNQQNWLSARWEYTAYFINLLCHLMGKNEWENSIRIWEISEGVIVGVVSTEDAENTFIQIHPGYRFIEEDMVMWAEENLAVPADEGNIKRITIWAHDKDELRKSILTKRGYKKSEDFEYLRWQKLDKEIPNIKLPEGYSILSLADGVDIFDKCETVAKAFKSSGLPLEVYREMQRAPLYRKDLDIVSIYEDNTISSFCTVWFEEKNRIGVFEPAGTHLDHQRKGLGKAVLIEGLKRLKALGAEIAYVGSYGEATGSFYESAGFINYEPHYPWTKKL
jgi:GNAT superfamily N-acetyltransferase